MTFDPPLALNPLPEVDTAEIVTLAVPTSVRVTGCATLFPTGEFPKLTLDELGVSWDDAAG